MSVFAPVTDLSDEEGDGPAMVPEAKAKATVKAKAKAKAAVKPSKPSVAKAKAADKPSKPSVAKSKAVVKPSESSPRKGALKKPAAAKSSMKRPASSIASQDGESDQGPPGAGVFIFYVTLRRLFSKHMSSIAGSAGSAAATPATSKAAASKKVSSIYQCKKATGKFAVKVDGSQAFQAS